MESSMRFAILNFIYVQTSHTSLLTLLGVRSFLIEELSEGFGVARDILSKFLQVGTG
jgi:O-antigen/teichoic acid export membrane protein